MTAKLHVDVVQTSSEGAVTLTKQSAAKAWLGAQADATQDETLNFSSSSDDGTGIYTHTLTNAMANDIEEGGLAMTAGGGARFARYGSTNTTTSVLEFRVHNSSGAYNDSRHNAIVHGDLA